MNHNIVSQIMILSQIMIIFNLSQVQIKKFFYTCTKIKLSNSKYWKKIAKYSICCIYTITSTKRVWFTFGSTVTPVKAHG